MLGDRFWRKVQQVEDCWVWTAGLTGDGYGSYKLDRKTQPAHRLAYTEMVDAIPEGLEIDHLCRNRACVNPAHLDPVPHHTNVLRGDSPTALHRRQSHCRRGHEFTPENTYVWQTARICKTCRAAHSRAHKVRLAAAGV